MQCCGIFHGGQIPRITPLADRLDSAAQQLAAARLGQHTDKTHPRRARHRAKLGIHYFHEGTFQRQRLGEAGPRDPACLSAWAESRERFLAPGARPGVRATPATEVPPTPPDAAGTRSMPDDPIRKEMAPQLDEAR